MSKQEGNSPDDSEDNFGLPEIDFKPIERVNEFAIDTSAEPPELAIEDEQPFAHAESEPPASINEEEQEAPPIVESKEEVPYLPKEADEVKKGSPVVIGLIIAALAVLVVSLIYFFIYKPRTDKALADKEAKEKVLALKEKAKQDSLARIEEEQRKAAAEKTVVVEKPAVGTIETLTERTNRYHVIVTSNIDDDLVMDFAKKLSTKGISTKLIPPFGKSQYYRLSISDQDSFDKAQADADAAKAEYGNNLWVLKY